MVFGRPERDPERPVYVISVAATLVSAHPRTLRIYEDEGLLCPARTPTNIRLYSENDIRRLTWIRHLTRERGVNLAGIRILFELEERLGARILEALYAEGTGEAESTARGSRPEPAAKAAAATATASPTTATPSPASADDPLEPTTHPSADRTPASSTVGET
jgi:MerR family transcriptional regulator/heat shock protein HspR